jgi:hypothetical protein
MGKNQRYATHHGDKSLTKEKNNLFLLPKGQFFSI